MFRHGQDVSTVVCGLHDRWAASMIHRILLLVLLTTASSSGWTQNTSQLPLIQFCSHNTQCEAGLGKLDDTQKQVIQKLLSIVTSGATEMQITQRFGREPYIKIPPTAALGQPAGTTTYRALWSTADPPARSFDPHFDVLFMNDRAVMFTWYPDWFRNVVRVQVSE
jgi:hypothetical protein